MANPDEKRKKALFPVSVDNPGFSTAMAVTALASIEEQYDEVVFLIADDLQLYNKVAHVRTGLELSEKLGLYLEKNVYFQEKKRWLEKVKKQLGGTIIQASWTFTSVSMITDQRFYNILRNIAILYQTTASFRRDVVETAREFCSRSNATASQIEVGLSIFYIIEEIAINIRIRVLENIRDEYYAFAYPKPLLRIYSGYYDIDVFALSGIPRQSTEFAFYALSKVPEPNWKIMEQ